MPSNDLGFTKSDLIFGEGERENLGFSFSKNEWNYRFSVIDNVNPKRFEPMKDSEVCSKTKRVIGNVSMKK